MKEIAVVRRADHPRIDEPDAQHEDGNSRAPSSPSIADKLRAKRREHADAEHQRDHPAAAYSDVLAQGKFTNVGDERMRPGVAHKEEKEDHDSENPRQGAPRSRNNPRKRECYEGRTQIATVLNHV